MKLIRGERTQSAIDKLNIKALDECDEVWAAIAYVTDDRSLIKPCYDRKIPLRLWARYDYSIPVRIDILEWFLGRSPLAVCKLIPDIFHPKVIWWRPYGVYIGSANLTQSAWFGNFETGVFLSEDEIEEQGVKPDLEAFFEEIDEASHALTKEVVADLRDFSQHQHFAEKENARKDFDARRKLPRLENLLSVKKRSGARERHRCEFLQEWSQTLSYIRDIAAKVSLPENRPTWLSEKVPSGVHADQFLHAYYYGHVMQKHKAHHREFHTSNAKAPHTALDEAIKWWHSLTAAPNDEDRMMNEWAPFIADKLTVDKIGTLDEKTFVEVFTKVHAFRNYADRANYKSLDLEQKLPSMNSAQRGEYLARRLYKVQNNRGEHILNVLQFLLYGGSASDLSNRLFEVAFDRDRRIPHAGLSTFGEIVGWALPNEFPPRNGRTSKALYALGYDVTIHTE